MSAKSMSMGVLAAILAASLVACGQSGQQQPGGAASSDGAPSQHTATNTHVTGAMLTVQPATVDGCKPNQPIEATVSWHSFAPKVRVMVAAPGQPEPHLFSESGFTGSAKTGDWVVSGTTFTLVEEKTETVLARTVVAQRGCEQ